MVDWVIENATIVDGSGSAPARHADLAIHDGKIHSIGHHRHTRSKERMDARGMVVSPGFIDVHTHDDLAVIREPDMLPKISQGVTTVIVGNCGISAAMADLPLGRLPDPMNLLGKAHEFSYASFEAYSDAVTAAGPSVNVACLVGHTTLRNNFLTDLNQPASPSERREMGSLLSSALHAGALGMSSGLAYQTARNAPTDEILDLLEIVSPFGGIYTTHLRNEFDQILPAMDEAITSAQSAGVRLVISHHKVAGKKNWGRTKETLAKLDEARRVLPVSCDCYPYSASSSTLDPGQVTDEIEIFITWSDPHPELAGRNLSDIAQILNMSLLDSAERIMPAGAIYHCMNQADVEQVLRWPHCMIGSDGLPCDPFPHPRLYGSFPRVIGRLRRDNQLFDLPTAIHKCTGLSATQFQIPQRGIIREGFWADLVVLDPDRINDRADFSHPRLLASGILAVFVNGHIAYSPDTKSIARHGRMIRRSDFL